MKLNVGCGDRPLAGYINLDANEELFPDVVARVPPLPYEDGAFEEIFACHFLEHLTQPESVEFLKECHRCLEDGGKLGLVVPDTREVMKRWLAKSPDCVEYPPGTWWPVNDLDAVSAIFLYATISGARHQWSYAKDTLGRAMAMAGFGNAKEIDRYRDPRLASPAWYQVGIEGVKLDG